MKHALVKILLSLAVSYTITLSGSLRQLSVAADVGVLREKHLESTERGKNMIGRMRTDSAEVVGGY